MPGNEPATPMDPRSGAAQQHELAHRIARIADTDGAHPTAVPRMHVFRCSRPQPCTPVFYEPRLCIVAQGSKLAVLDGETYRYDALNYLVVSMPLPIASQIVDASPERPYLALKLDLDLDEVGALLLDMEPAVAPAVGVDRALYAARTHPALLDAVLRLMRLLDSPDDLAVLAPMALREITYRLLQGELGGRLRRMSTAGTHSHRIARAVTLLRERYLEPLSIDALAHALHMSSSSLHHQFKAATAMSPLQFQKRLRLHEARRLMLVDGLEAAVAAHRVGYESPSQFSREYKRLFGAPPRTEIGQWRAVRSA